MTFEQNEKKVKLFLKKHPFLKEMWKKYDKAYCDFLWALDIIETQYKQECLMGKHKDVDTVDFFWGESGVVGIDINEGYGAGGYDFKKNKMLVQQNLLEGK